MSPWVCCFPSDATYARSNGREHSPGWLRTGCADITTTPMVLPLAQVPRSTQSCGCAGGIGHDVGRIGLRSVVHHPHRTRRCRVVRPPRLVWTAVDGVVARRRLHQCLVGVCTHVFASTTQHMRQDELVLASTPTHAVCVAGVGVQSPLGKVSTAAVKPLPRLRQARWVQTREQTFNSSQTRARRGRHVSRQSRHPPFESRSHQGLCKSRQGPTRWCRATTAVRSDWPRPGHHPHRRFA